MTLTLIVTTATEENVYLKKCQVVTKNKRRYPAEIESRYQEKNKKFTQYRIIINVGYLENVKEIDELIISCLNINKDVEDNLNIVIN